MLNPEDVLELVEELETLQYFPRAPGARVAIARLIAAMAHDINQARRLVTRMTDGSTFNDWPGPHEMRACFCSMWKPRDGIEASSAIYPDGFPPIRPQAPQIASPERKRLERGEALSDDPELDAIVRRAAEKRRLAAKPKAPTPTPNEIEEPKRIQRERAQHAETREILANQVAP